jgi:hypothetical protein
MKYALFLLAVMAMAMVGTVRGAELGAQIEGWTFSGSFCTAEQQHELYQECVEQAFFDMEGVLDRRLELRGSGRKLESDCPKCTEQMKNSSWHWCWHQCSSNARRKLTVADERAHTERFLVTRGELEQKANECLDNKITNGYECLGNPEDLAIKIFLSE